MLELKWLAAVFMNVYVSSQHPSLFVCVLHFIRARTVNLQKQAHTVHGAGLRSRPQGKGGSTWQLVSLQ